MGIFAFKRKREQEATFVASVLPKKTKPKSKQLDLNGDNNSSNSRKRNSK